MLSEDIEIDGLRFELKWLHKNDSPFVRSGGQLHWERVGHTVSQLPDNAGLRVEPWRDKGKFLFSFIIPAYSTLIYDIELVAYYRSNASVPSWKSKTANEWIWE